MGDCGLVCYLGRPIRVTLLDNPVLIQMDLVDDNDRTTSVVQVILFFPSGSQHPLLVKLTTRRASMGPRAAVAHRQAYHHNGITIPSDPRPKWSGSIR